MREPRVLLDPERLLTVLRLVRDLCQAGRQQGLLDEVWRRISDAETLERADLQESLASPCFRASGLDHGCRARWDELR